MASYLESKFGTANILVATSDQVTESQERGIAFRPKSFEEIVNEIKAAARNVIDELDSLGLEEIELAYGIKLGCKGGVSFWCIAEASAEANFTIKIKWKRP